MHKQLTHSQGTSFHFFTEEIQVQRPTCTGFARVEVLGKEILLGAVHIVEAIISVNSFQINFDQIEPLFRNLIEQIGQLVNATQRSEYKVLSENVRHVAELQRYVEFLGVVSTYLQSDIRALAVSDQRRHLTSLREHISNIEHAGEWIFND